MKHRVKTSTDQLLMSLVLRAIIFRYLSFSIAALAIYLFHETFPFPYPLFFSVLLVGLFFNTVLNILYIKRISVSVSVICAIFFDISANLSFIYCSGGFLSPFIITSIVSLIVIGTMPLRKKSICINMYIIFLVGYNAISLSQKFGLLPNYVEYAENMMHNDAFFYFILLSTNTIVALSYTLIITFNEHMQMKLSMLSNSFKKIVESTAAEYGDTLFKALTQHLAEALHVSTACIAIFDKKLTQCTPAAIWHQGEHCSLQPYEIRNTAFSRVLQNHHYYCEMNIADYFPDDSFVKKFSLQGLSGICLKNEEGAAVGVIMIANTAMLINDYSLCSMLKIFASRAAAEINRMINEEEKARIQHQLVQAQKLEAIGQLAGGIAHDFNNMLNAIIGYAELIRRKNDLDASEKYSERILTICRRAAELTSQLLAYARKGAMQIKPVDIHKVIAIIADILRHTIDKRIRLTLDLKASHYITMGDFSQLQNALLNIALNARDAMPEGGQMTFTTDIYTISKQEDILLSESVGIQCGTYLLVSISDTGSGMDEETQKHVFEPFFTTKEVGKGTGLGLSVAYGCIKKHKGHISIKSNPEKGTVFYIYLPLCDNHNGKTNDSAEYKKGNSAITKKATLLLIDDEEQVCESLAALFSDIGHKVTTCSNGNDGLDYFKNNNASIDLVILDVVMPEISGIDVFVAMKEINPEVKVLFLSAYSDENQVAMMTAEKAAGYIKKPFDPQDIVKRIEDILTHS